MNKRRQELYDRIRESSRDEVIVEEMRRLGFWPSSGQLPVDPADEIKRQGQLQRQLRELQQELALLGDEQRILNELRRERLEESRRKRKETKEHHKQQRQARAQAWLQRKNDSVVYLGEGYSAGLGANAAAGPQAAQPQSDEQRLAQAGLPSMHLPAELAAALDISLGELRFLAYGRKTAKVSHYIRFELPKKTGGTRLISAPMPRLKSVQRWLLTELLNKVELHKAAHGFVPSRSIVSNASPHIGKRIVINLDLKDFFPSFDYRRVRGMFRHLGYSEPLATIMSLLCTEPAVEQVELDGETYYVAQSARRLPQGSPASPAVTNIICRRMDRRLSGLAEALGYTYTRYADDITFSGDDPRQVCNVLRKVTDIVEHEGFTVHPNKTRVMRNGRCQEVTGIVVNHAAGVQRKELRRFRALIHQVKRDGPKGKSWGQSTNLFASMRGFANFVAMVTPDKGAALLQQVNELAQEHGGYRQAAAPTAQTSPSWQRYQPPSAAADPEEATANAVEQAVEASEQLGSEQLGSELADSEQPGEPSTKSTLEPEVIRKKRQRRAEKQAAAASADEETPQSAQLDKPGNSQLLTYAMIALVVLLILWRLSKL